MSELILVSASGLAREVLAMVRSSGQYDVVGLLDDDREMAGVTVDGAPVLGSIDDAVNYTHAFFLVCIAASKEREAVVSHLASLGVGEPRYGTAVDPSAQYPEGCRVGRGSILLRNVTLTAAVTLGSHVVAMPSVTFSYDVDVSDFATFAAGVSLGGWRQDRQRRLSRTEFERPGTDVGGRLRNDRRVRRGAQQCSRRRNLGGGAGPRN